MKPQSNLTLEQIDTDDLAKICCRLAEIILSGHKLDGAWLAHLAKRLITAEVAPGGPYRENGKAPNFETNLAIGYLFSCLKKPLTNVDNFIATNREKQHSLHIKKLLSRYDTVRRAAQTSSSTVEETSHMIYRQVKDQFSHFDKDLEQQGLSFLMRLQKADKNHEITLFPRIFYRSLSCPFSFPPLAFLGEANVYTWIAYTIYDHLLDGQSNAVYLPIANVAMRLALSRYHTIFPFNHSFHQKVSTTFDAIDAANAWEVSHARCEQNGDSLIIPPLPVYGRHEILADRSFAHALGPLAVATLATSNNGALQFIEKGLRHYLIARQLNDDLHDWQQDIRNGQLSAVVSSILRQAKVKPGAYPTDTLIKRMQSHFWNHSMDIAAQAIIRHADLSHKYFQKSGIIKEKSELSNLVRRLKTIALTSQKEHERFKSFATTYRKLS